jgi:CRISPR-associated protein Csm3
MQHLKINGTLEVKTGLHIGGIKETIKIGGQDAPVIKIKIGKNDIPYIPGSSLKGKLRHLLENKYSENDETIKNIFGSSGENSSRGKVIFRDAHLSNINEYLDENGNLIKEKIFEIKPENKIDRTTGKAEHPRFIERVIPGTKFDIELVVIFKENDEKNKILEKLKEGFELLQNDYLGGSGTRGYGKVDVQDIINKIDNEIKKRININ